MMKHEIEVDHRSPFPKGYGFLKKGNPYQTRVCRELTHAEGHALYVVTLDKRPIGLRAPNAILAQVREQDLATRSTRTATVARRDQTTAHHFRRALLENFPRIPASSAEEIVKHTLQKSSGRVGRTGTLDVKDKVWLAVTAHVRHRHTEYDTLLKTVDKTKARKAVAETIKKTVEQWSGKSVKRTTSKQRKCELSSQTTKPLPQVPTVPRDKLLLPPLSKRQQKLKRKRERLLKKQSKVEKKGEDKTDKHLKPDKRLSRLQTGPNFQHKALDHFFNDEDEPIEISSDDSDGEHNEEEEEADKRLSRLQTGPNYQFNALNDEDEPMVISSDDSDEEEKEEKEQKEEKDVLMYDCPDDSDGFLVYDTGGDSEDEFLPF